MARPSIADRIRAAAETDGLLTASALGVEPSALVRMERAGVLSRVVPGVYLGAARRRHPLAEAAAWQLRHPSAVTCLLSAALHHDLTDARPQGTWLFVPFGDSPPRSRVVRVHVVQIAPRFVDPADDMENGVGKLIVHGVETRLTDPDRTTIDLWRYPRRVSSEHALEALRRRVGTRGFDLPRFARLARRLDAWGRLEPVVQGLVLR